MFSPEMQLLTETAKRHFAINELKTIFIFGDLSLSYCFSDGRTIHISHITSVSHWITRIILYLFEDDIQESKSWRIEIEIHKHDSVMFAFFDLPEKATAEQPKEASITKLVSGRQIITYNQSAASLLHPPTY